MVQRIHILIIIPKPVSRFYNCFVLINKEEMKHRGQMMQHLFESVPTKQIMTSVGFSWTSVGLTIRSNQRVVDTIQAMRVVLPSSTVEGIEMVEGSGLAQLQCLMTRVLKSANVSVVVP